MLVQEALSLVQGAAVTTIGSLHGSMVARLVVTLVLCGAIGLDRSARDHASGLRPHILVGLGACLMTQAGAYGFADLAHLAADPTRVASYVVSGIGFLGAGAILRHGTTVRGMTTAASLWGVAGVGIAVGAGVAGLATVTVLLTLFTLRPLKSWEARLRYGENARELLISVSDDSQSVGKTLAALNRLGVPIRQATAVPGVGTSAVIRAQLAQGLRSDQVALVTRRLLALRCVERVETALLDQDDEDFDTAGAPTVRDVDVTDCATEPDELAGSSGRRRS